jgi:phosphoribosylanthranilate isomerase
MKIKICGMRNPSNIEAVAALPIHFMGFIFYDKSPRYVAPSDDISTCPDDLTKVGVFVNADIDFVLHKMDAYDLDAVQLHGSETPQYIEDLANKMWSKMRFVANSDIEIIKAFPVDSAFDFETVKPYQELVKYFLFDTKTPQHGGAGVKFDWSILERYDSEVPFLLAGGISENDIEAIAQLKSQNPQLYGLDLNSKFETEPALKNVEKLESFLSGLNRATAQKDATDGI